MVRREFAQAMPSYTWGTVMCHTICSPLSWNPCSGWKNPVPENLSFFLFTFVKLAPYLYSHILFNLQTKTYFQLWKLGSLETTPRNSFDRISIGYAWVGPKESVSALRFWSLRFWNSWTKMKKRNSVHSLNCRHLLKISSLKYNQNLGKDPGLFHFKPVNSPNTDLCTTHVLSDFVPQDIINHFVVKMNSRKPSQQIITTYEPWSINVHYTMRDV